MNNPYSGSPNAPLCEDMQIATLADLGELIESHQNELLSDWLREVALLRGAEKLDRPTITDHIPQLLTELSENQI